MLAHPNKPTLQKLAKINHHLTQKAITLHMKYCIGHPDSYVDPEHHRKPKKEKIKATIENLNQPPEISPERAIAERQFRDVNGPLEELKAEAANIRHIAMEKMHLGTALIAIDKEARLIETQVKIAAELREQEKHNENMQKKEWARTQQFIWRFMDDHGLTEAFWDGLADLGVADAR